jgi:uncharacterized DUF497 family protein
MDFEWDPPKSAECASQRRFDFAFATQIFNGPVMDWEDTRRDYGGQRVIAVGRAGTEVLTVVYTERTQPGGGMTRRIISARRSSQNERKAYQASLENR